MLARIVSSAVAGVDPSVMGIGPVSACRRALHRAGWTLDEDGLSKPTRLLPSRRWPSVSCLSGIARRSDVNGGAIALGHPIGASGCRILVSLVHEMQRRAPAKELATPCASAAARASP
ncbi:hypothetical protein LNP74_29870 [Klebsiella pneumoniae subsp. pneumoniae]|nr:hypothetical protein [Klebsiella pneumoniae subsp. pneumoniae]